jgi:hypothetical protein
MKYSILIVVVLCILSCSKKPDTQEIEKLAITSFSPTSGTYGDTVTINGKGFGNDPARINISIGTSFKFRPFSATDTKLLLVIPKEAGNGAVGVDLGSTQRIGIDYAVANGNFTLNIPEPVAVTGTLPDFLRIGDTVSFSGTAFGSDPARITVRFGTSINAKPSQVSGTGLKFIVPEIYYHNPTAPNGIVSIREFPAVKITIVKGSDSITLNKNFKILPPHPTIFDFSPKKVRAGDTLRITGKNFYYADDLSQILHIEAGTIQSPYFHTSTELRVKISIGDTISKSPIRVVVRSGYDFFLISESNRTPDSLTTMPQTIVYNMSPSHAKAGEQIMITGKFKVADFSTITLRFTGSATDVKLDLSGTQKDNVIYAKVPADAKTGPVSVTIAGFVSGTTPNSLIILP